LDSALRCRGRVCALRCNVPRGAPSCDRGGNTSAHKNEIPRCVSATTLTTVAHSEGLTGCGLELPPPPVPPPPLATMPPATPPPTTATAPATAAPAPIPPGAPSERMPAPIAPPATMTPVQGIVTLRPLVFWEFCHDRSATPVMDCSNRGAYRSVGIAESSVFLLGFSPTGCWILQGYSLLIPSA
jgi:hypothetical protein